MKGIIFKFIQIGKWRSLFQKDYVIDQCNLENLSVICICEIVELCYRHVSKVRDYADRNAHDS